MYRPGSVATREVSRPGKFATGECPTRKCSDRRGSYIGKCFNREASDWDVSRHAPSIEALNRHTPKIRGKPEMTTDATPGLCGHTKQYI